MRWAILFRAKSPWDRLARFGPYECVRGRAVARGHKPTMPQGKRDDCVGFLTDSRGHMLTNFRLSGVFGPIPVVLA